MTPEVRLPEDGRIERLLSLVDEASRPRPLPEVLGTLCAEISAILEVPVASVYLRESDELVLRANVGLAGRQIGHARLPLGDGITGFAAERRRPVSVRSAAQDEHYKAVPGLDDDRYPRLLAIPVLVGHRSEAVLVLQSEAERPFDDARVLLATALSTALAYALERARTRTEQAQRRGPRRARLPGLGRAPGVALGRAEAPPTFDGLAALARAAGLEEEEDPARRLANLERALKGFVGALQRVIDRVLAADADLATALGTLPLIWQDQRFQDELVRAAADHRNPAHALAALARSYARVSVGVEALETRSREVEALCLQVGARVVDARFPSKGAVVLLSETPPALLVLVSLSHKASAIAVGANLSVDELGVRVARAGGLPVVAGVGGLFAWAREGDRILIDADAGVAHLNPEPGVVARFRRRRAGGSPSPPEDSAP